MKQMTGNVKIEKEEFKKRIERIQERMESRGINLFIVYGDEYRKENLRYVSNYWPIFERGALLINLETEPMLLCAPEGQKVAEEMSVWSDIRLSPDFLCVTVPEKIDYPFANYTSFEKLSKRFPPGNKKIAIAGMDAMSVLLYEKIKAAFDCDLVDGNEILYDLRKVKSKNEIACLERAAHIAEKGIKRLVQSDLIGMSELQAASIVESAARDEGAEHIIFHVFGSGRRTDTIVGRPSSKIIEDGDMIMSALAVQYEGYVATCEIPFAVGDYSDETKRVIDVLIKARNRGRRYLSPGRPMKEFVSAVKSVFREEKLEDYDVYPPLHGIGCAEAESPYPNEQTDDVFRIGMTVNTDISLFGLPGGSNRIEEGFVITEEGSRSLSPFVEEYCVNWESANKNI